MTTTATAPVPQTAPKPAKPKRAPRPLTLEVFRKKYSDREDGFKYEFNNGIIEKTPNPMKVKQYHIVKNLTRKFIQTEAFKNGDELASELDQLTSATQLRRPDLALLTAQKLANNDETVSEFVIEIISPTDSFEAVGAKVREYFAAGVRVIWQIVPAWETVYVFTSPTKITVCEGETMCSAAPVLPDFEMTAQAIFAK